MGPKQREHRWKAWAGLPGFVIAFIPAACTVGPDYVPPAAPAPPAYKELKGWKKATPSDDVDRGAWWSVFKDRRLDELASQVELTNQTVAASEAAYRQTLAVIKEAQAGLFPAVTGNYNVIGEHFGRAAFGSRGAGSLAGVRTSAGGGFTTTIATLSANATWDVDLWGKIRRMVESDVASAQVSAADLANAKLSAQAMLATAYYNLRGADALQALYHDTVVAYKRTLEITQNQYNAGTVAKSDVDTALAQLLNTQALYIGVGVQRAQFEHSIAVLMGKTPAELTIPPIPLGYRLPDIPVSVPSALLERRPDIAASERAVQQENALIGAAVALYYPDLSLSGMFGFAGTGALALSLANELWTISGSVAQTAFDAGLRDAQVEAAVATYKQSVATYRQTVLTGFQQVEDQLAAIRIYAREQKVADASVKAAREEVDVLLNQYRAGTVAFTAVVVAQAMLLSNQETALAVRQNRFLAAVSLIEALGGGWQSALLPSMRALVTRNRLIPDLQ
jgi:NodT family efflux transporter outer membrane factor (OMF) lipoprotein